MGPSWKQSICLVMLCIKNNSVLSCEHGAASERLSTWLQGIDLCKPGLSRDSTGNHLPCLPALSHADLIGENALVRCYLPLQLHTSQSHLRHFRSARSYQGCFRSRGYRRERQNAATMQPSLCSI